MVVWIVVGVIALVLVLGIVGEYAQRARRVERTAEHARVTDYGTRDPATYDMQAAIQRERERERGAQSM